MISSFLTLHKLNNYHKQLFDGGTLQDYLTTGIYILYFLSRGFTHNPTLLVKAWLDANPNEGLFFPFLRLKMVISNFSQVLSILIVNVDNFPPTAYEAVYQAVGLDTISYSPQAAVTTVFNWPTLGSMIDNGLRLVTFLDNGADFTSVPYIIDGTHVSPKTC